MATGFTKPVQEVMRGALLPRFLRLYHDGLRGAQLWQILRRSDSYKNLSDSEVSLVFQQYKRVGQAGDSFLRRGRNDRAPFSSIPTNGYLDVRDRVLDRVSYYVRVKGGNENEESVHDRTIRVTSDIPLTRAELAARVGDAFGETFYTEGGDLMSDTNDELKFVSIEFLGVVRKW